MEDKAAKQLADIAMSCALACMNGAPTVTITARGKRPAGFPRCELLSIGSDGSHNYACHPVKVLAWIHGLASMEAVSTPSASRPAQSPPER